MRWGHRSLRRLVPLVIVAVTVSCTVPPQPPPPGGTTSTTTPATSTTTRPATTTTARPTTTTRPATTTTRPATTTSTTQPAPAGDFPGAVPAGHVRWGAAVAGNADPVPRHETPSGQPLAVRRTFWRWDQRTGSMMNVVRDDLAHDRLPWVSLKPGGSWHDMGAGVFDAQIDEVLRALEATGGPVWLTLHHEPEGGGGVNAPDDPGGAAEWRNMQRRIRQRMTALGTENIAFAPILMSWTWDSRSGRNPDDWWVPGIWDFYGIDHYNEDEGPVAVGMWLNARRWIGDRGLAVGVGEWGKRGTDAAAGQRVRDWYEQAIASGSDGRGAQVIALAAFDSNLNSPSGGWELEGGQLDAFRQLLGDPRTLTASEP